MEWVAILAQLTPTVNTALLIVLLERVKKLERRIDELEREHTRTRERVARLEGRVNGLARGETRR